MIGESDSQCSSSHNARILRGVCHLFFHFSSPVTSLVVVGGGLTMVAAATKVLNTTQYKIFDIT